MRKRVVGIALLIILISPLFSLSRPPSVEAIGDSWLSGWTYRREIDISGCEINLTDFQVEIDLGADLFPLLPENAPTYQNTPTSDATNQTVHPSILYFPEGWNGYKYWMAYTPYPGGNPATETPEIVACNDGVNWVVPDGLTNPIVARDANDPNSDPCLFYNDTTDEIWIYYRKTDSDGMLWDKIYLKKTSDGINWGGTGQGTLVLDLAYAQALSPTIVKVGSIYHMWYIDARNGNTLKHRTSADSESWGAETTDNLYGFMPSGKEPWHLEVRYNAEYSIYFMLLTICNIGTSGANSVLTFARSMDGTKWYLHDEVFLNLGTGGDWDDNAVYKATAILDGSDFKIWYSAKKSVGGLWHIGYTNTTINLDSLQMIESTKDDLGDVRFTIDNGETEIPYYIDLPSLTGWVKIPSILVIPENATIYIYYGNPTAETTSNGTATFIDFNPMDNITIFDNRFDKRTGTDRALDNTTYGRTMIKLPDTDGGGSTSYNATISWPNNSAYIYEYYYSSEATGGTTYPYGGVYGRGNDGANGLWLTGPKGGDFGDNDLWSGAHYVFGTFEEATVYQWQVILNGSSRTVLNVLVEDGDEYTTDRGWGSAFDHDELWLDAVGTIATGSAWFGVWWIRKYCSLQPITGEWGEAEEAPEGGGENTAPTRGAYILDQFDAPDLLSDGEPNTRFWFSASDVDGYATIDTLEVAIRVGSTWCNFSYDTTAEGGGSWTKTTEQPYVELFNDGWGGTSSSYYMYAWIQANPGAPDTYGVDVYQRIIDTSSGSSGWGQIYGTPFNIVESGDDSGSSGGAPSGGDPDEPPPEGPGDPDWWMDEDNLNDMDRDDLEVLADALGIDVDDSDTKDDIIAKILDKAEEDGFTAFEGCGLTDEEKLALLDYLLNMSIPELRLECQDLGISYKLWRDPEPYIILIFTVGYGCTPPDEFYEQGYFDPTDWDGDGVSNWDDPDMFDAERIGLGARVEDIDISTSIPWIQQNGYLVILLALFLAFMYSQVKKADKPGSRGESLLRPPGKGYVPGERK